MKKAILISIACIIVATVYFGYQFFVGLSAMAGAKDIKTPSIENINTIDDIVQPYMDHKATKGLSIGVYDNGNITYYNYGICSDENPVPPNNQSVYEIGSITKTFTTAALVQMIEEGKVQYNDPVSKYLPQELVNWPDSVNITLEELATHRSGLPRLPANSLKRTLLNWDNPYKYYSEEDLHDFLKSYSPKPKGKRKVVYSNLGMGLLGYILAQINDQSYKELIETNLTKPLGMNNTYASFKDNTQITGHKGNGKPTSAWEFQTFKGAGSIRSSTADMMKYIIANLQSQFPYGETHNPRADFGKKYKIGLGWLTIFPKDTNLELLFHNGGTGGFRTAILFSKEKQMGVIVLANSIQSVDAIGFRIIELLEKQRLAIQKPTTESH